MNVPTVDKFLPTMKTGGTLLINSSIITEKIARNDVKVVKIDATNIAVQLSNPKVQNMVILAGFIKSVNLFALDDIRQILEQKFGEKNQSLFRLISKQLKKV